ncbi:MAG: DUF983 domain-containing protein [Alphaproteobacteria bacterium]
MAEYFGEVSPLKAGFLCRCPRCGQGKLYRGLLTVAPVCNVCQLDMAAEDSGDGAAAFVILIVGAIAVLIAFVVETSFSPSPLLHLVIQIPLVIGLSILLLRPFKATLIAMQYRHKAAGFE